MSGFATCPECHELVAVEHQEEHQKQCPGAPSLAGSAPLMLRVDAQGHVLMPPHIILQLQRIEEKLDHLLVGGCGRPGWSQEREGHS